MSTIVPEATDAQVQAIEQALYRFFGTDGALLYVGISIHPFARMGQHRADKSWWGEVASMTIEKHPDRASVIAAEREAIKAEHPRYNVVHSASVDAIRRSRPKLFLTYTYWEPSIGATVTVANIMPMHMSAFYLPCENCTDQFLATDITDHGEEDFCAHGACPECGTSAAKFIPRVHPRGVEHLSEHSPYWLIQQRGRR